MNKFVLYTDSACDLAPELLEKIGVKCVSMTFTFDGDDRTYNDNEILSAEFYAMMRKGKIVRTAAINAERFKEAFSKDLEAGNDVLYLGFSSGLSTTFNCAKMAAEELRESFPDRQIEVADSLSASGGFGLLVYLTAQFAAEGNDIEETLSFINEKIPHICHWFTVDDLSYLKRGGRISPTVAFVGGLLGIKPVLHTDGEGRLVNVSKVRGRRASVTALADKYDATALNKFKGDVFICHADCAEDAEFLSGLLKRRYRLKSVKTMNIGSVIGAHSGPGTLALFYEGKER